tara:strand:- start:8221 stop:9306 length:1086 start_codon:yes stop_codon:yes gene_type:complete
MAKQTVKRGNKYYSNITVNGKRVRKALSVDPATAKMMVKELETRLLMELYSKGIIPGLNKEVEEKPKPKTKRVKFKEGVNIFIDDSWYDLNIKNPYKNLTFRTPNGTAAANVLSRLKQYEKHSKITYIDEVSFENLSAFMRSREKKCAANTMKRTRGFLVRFFNFAENMDWINKSPARKLKKYKMEKKTPYHFTDEEITKIMDSAGVFKLFYQFMLYTGIRCTDLFEMTRDVFYMHPETKRMYISFHMSKTGEELNVPLLPEAEALLPFLGDDYLFPGFQGTGWDDYRRAQNWNLMENFKLIEYHKKGIRNHTFRHTFAMNLINKGTPKEVIQQLLGHTSITTTEIYANKMKKENLEKWTN